MGFIYDNASDGTLTANDLRDSKKEEINAVNPVTKLTPLGVAVWNGHENQVRILLYNNAHPDGVGPTEQVEVRPPLWVAASRTRRNAGNIMQLLLNHGADPSKPSVPDDNTTPLLAAVKVRRRPGLISALVDAGASPDDANNKGETARDCAMKRKDRATLTALLPSNQRSSSRLDTLFLLSGLMLFVVAWANKEGRTRNRTAGAALIAAGIIKRRFEWSGIFESKWIPSSLAAARYSEEFREDVREYITKTNLDRFFPPGDEFLETVVKKAVNLHENQSNTIDVHDLTRLSLYQPVLYCDDSGSMIEGERKERQNELVQQITSITTRLVPDDKGIELRFINKEVEPGMSKPSLSAINDIMTELDCDGWTEIGTNLRRKILQDIVYKPLENGTFERPVLVSIITDGCPMGPSGTLERYDTLKKTILECGQILRRHNYNPKVVRFQISQIGSDRDARRFLNALDTDAELKDVLYCTAQRLDDEFVRLGDNEWRLEQWLLQLLMGPIMDADPK